MPDLPELFENNRAWAKRQLRDDPAFFAKLVEQQTPQYLWIGCSDSRVPANEIIGLPSGKLFVHRNVANIVVNTDLNCLSVLQYAVEVLRIEHIIVCGHYGCGGVLCALRDGRMGLIDNWLRNVQDVGQQHVTLLARHPDETRRCDLLCELNVIEQVRNVARTTIVRNAWEDGQTLRVHGWIYRLTNGLLNDLGVSAGDEAELHERYHATVRRMTE